jgi:hypothetical protein
MALGFFGSFTFTAYSMPLRMLPVFGSLNIGAYLLVYAVAGATRPGFVPVEIAGMPATGTACTQQHHRLVQQCRRLHEMALTGCLNRRGFENASPGCSPAPLRGRRCSSSISTASRRSMTGRAKPRDDP